jgi:4-amino-4-deoxy-L-arabinose transferase-like glycosyltransferase
MMDESVPKLYRSRIWLFAALAAVFLRALPNLRYPIGRDQATYYLIGQGLLRGHLLYRDLWDNKPPGVFYISAVIVKIFGPVMWSIGIVDILWLLAISICIFYFAKRYLGAPAAAIAVVFNALWHCSWGYIHAAQPETFLMLFVFLAYFLLMSARARNWWGNFAAGLLCGAAFWVKYNAAPFFPVLTFLPYLDLSRFDEQPRRVQLTISWRVWFERTLVVVAGFLLTIAAVLIYFWGVGGWPALKEVQFEVLPRYASTFLTRVPHYNLWAIQLTYVHLGAWTEAAFGAALLIAWWRRQLRVVAPVLVMAIAGYVSTASQTRFSSYCFETAYPFFAMVWGYVIVKLCEGFVYLRDSLARHGWRLAGLLLWLVAAQVVYYPLPDYAFSIGEEYGCLREWVNDPHRSYAEYLFPHSLEKLHDQLAIIDYLEKNSAPGDGVFVWGTAPLINFLAQRPSPSRFVSNFALISPWGPARWRQDLIDELDRNPPRFIVVARHDAIPGVTFTYDDSEQCLEKYPALAAYIRSGYEPVKNLHDFEVYRHSSP